MSVIHVFTPLRESWAQWAHLVMAAALSILQTKAYAAYKEAAPEQEFSLDVCEPF